MQIWTGNDFTTCCAVHNDRDEPEDGYEEDDGRRSAQMLGCVIVYALVAVAGTAISCVCWWLAHR